MLSRAKTEELPDMFNLTKLGITDQIKNSRALTTHYLTANKKPSNEGLKQISEDTSKDEEDEEQSSYDKKFPKSKQDDSPDKKKSRRKSFKTVYQAQESGESDSAHDSKNLEEIQREETSPFKTGQIRVSNLGSKGSKECNHLVLENCENKSSKVSIPLLEDHHNLVDVKEFGMKEPKVHPISIPEQPEITEEPDTWSNI